MDKTMPTLRMPGEHMVVMRCVVVISGGQIYVRSEYRSRDSYERMYLLPYIKECGHSCPATNSRRALRDMVGIVLDTRIPCVHAGPRVANASFRHLGPPTTEYGAGVIPQLSVVLAPPKSFQTQKLPTLVRTCEPVAQWVDPERLVTSAPNRMWQAVYQWILEQPMVQPYL